MTVLSKAPVLDNGHLKFDNIMDVEVDIGNTGKKVYRLHKQHLDTSNGFNDKVTILTIV